MIDDHAGLLYTRTAEQAEMCGDDPHALLVLEVEFGNERAARLETGQVDFVDVAHQSLAEEYDIAMPAMRGGRLGKWYRYEPMLALQPFEMKQALALPEAGVDLLQ